MCIPGLFLSSLASDEDARRWFVSRGSSCLPDPHSQQMQEVQDQLKAQAQELDSVRSTAKEGAQKIPRLQNEVATYALKWSAESQCWS